eukprot:UN00517
MTLIHFAIHSLALMYLLVHIDVAGNFYKSVFHMAEEGYATHWYSANMGFCVLGTLQDVSLHLLNAKDLLISEDGIKSIGREHEQHHSTKRKRD